MSYRLLHRGIHVSGQCHGSPPKKKTVVQRKKKSQCLISVLCHVALYELCVWGGTQGGRHPHRLLKWEDIIAWPPLALRVTAYDERKMKRNRDEEKASAKQLHWLFPVTFTIFGKVYFLRFIISDWKKHVSAFGHHREHSANNLKVVKAESCNQRLLKPNFYVLQMWDALVCAKVVTARLGVLGRLPRCCYMFAKVFREVVCVFRVCGLL